MSKNKTEQIAVVSRVKGGFRRAGYKFTDKPTVIDVADLKKGQLEQIKSEHNLVVVDSVSDLKPATDDTALKEANAKLAESEKEVAALKAKLAEAEKANKK